jgi:hypothetical protein
MKFNKNILPEIVLGVSQVGCVLLACFTPALHVPDLLIRLPVAAALCLPFFFFLNAVFSFPIWKPRRKPSWKKFMSDDEKEAAFGFFVYCSIAIASVVLLVLYHKLPFLHQDVVWKKSDWLILIFIAIIWAVILLANIGPRKERGFSWTYVWVFVSFFTILSAELGAAVHIYRHGRGTIAFGALGLYLGAGILRLLYYYLLSSRTNDATKKTSATAVVLCETGLVVGAICICISWYFAS